MLGPSRAELRAAGVPRHEVLHLLDEICDLCEAEQSLLLVSPMIKYECAGVICSTALKGSFGS